MLEDGSGFIGWLIVMGFVLATGFVGALGFRAGFGAARMSHFIGFFHARRAFTGFFALGMMRTALEIAGLRGIERNTECDCDRHRKKRDTRRMAENLGNLLQDHAHLKIIAVKLKVERNLIRGP